MRKHVSTTHTNLDLTNVDRVPSTGTRSGSNAMLYVFDNEAVIEMIIKGQRPRMRHVSRTHQTLDWLFDKINLDSKVQIRYIDTNHPFADTQWPSVLSYLTNGTIFFICSTSAIAVLFAALRVAAW